MLFALVAFAWNGPSENPPGGSGTISVDVSNNVGVGTSAPTGKLTVRRSTAGNAFVVRNTGDTVGNFTINEIGQVGVGMVPEAATRLGLGASATFFWPLFITTDDGTARRAGIQYPAAPAVVSFGTESAHSLVFTTGSTTEPGIAFSRIEIDTKGRVGMGGIAPTASARLTIVEPGKFSLPSVSPTVVRLGSHNNATDGSSLRAKGSVTGALPDLTEYVAIQGKVVDYFPGDILEISEKPDTFRKSKSPYAKRLAGVVSKSGGLIMGGEDGVVFDENGRSTNKVQLALAGRLPVKVSDEGGSIDIGDPITSSSIEGVGMKATKSGRVIGLALESHTDKGLGYVKILINPHYWIAE